MSHSRYRVRINMHVFRIDFRIDFRTCLQNRLRINMHVCAHQPFQASSCQHVLIIASIIDPSDMPLIDSDPPDYRYVYILIQMRNFRYQLHLYSGYIDMSDFAAAVERALHGLHCIQGATGRCHAIQFLSYTHMNSVAPCIGYSCFYCGQMSMDLRMCQGCSFARYCSHRCQRLHWRSGHRDVCTHIVFDHRSRRLPPLHVMYGIMSAYDYNIWTHLLPRQ